MIQVVAAIIVHEGRVLICQRRADDRFPLKWEFPGGKVRAGEKLAEALGRELVEELGVQATVGQEVYRTRHKYAEMEDEVEMVFSTVRANARAVRNLAFAQIVWAPAEELPKYDFLAADEELVRLLATGDLRM